MARAARPADRWFVAVVDGVDVGLAACAEHRDSDGSAHVISMWVAPQARRVGAGRLLLDACVAWARERALTPVRLEVVDANAAAVTLYERYGFLPTGVVGTFPPPREHLSEHERALHLRPVHSGASPAVGPVKARIARRRADTCCETMACVRSRDRR